MIITSVIMVVPKIRPGPEPISDRLQALTLFLNHDNPNSHHTNPNLNPKSNRSPGRGLGQARVGHGLGPSTDWVWLDWVMIFRELYGLEWIG